MYNIDDIRNKIKIGDRVKAVYISGSGTEYEEGEFKISKITKTFMFLKMTKKGFFAQYPEWKERKIPLKDFKKRKEPMPSWISDKEFVCYHNQSGIPMIYTIVKN